MGKKQSDFFKIPKYNGCGIYAIICWEDFSCYVGSTTNMRNRANQHKSELKKGKHKNKNLQLAYDKGKILRFVILSKLDDDTPKDILLLEEYLYMLQMKYKCFDLYNIQPSSELYKTKTERLQVSILCILDNIISASGNIENALIDEYGSNSGYMRNTKYREWSAKHQSTV